MISSHNPIAGAGCLAEGFGLITRPGLRRYVFIPLLVNLVLFGALIVLGAAQFSAVVDWTLSFLPGWLDWLGYLLWPLFALVVLVATFYTFTLAANLIGAPFNGMLAEAVERQLTGETVAQAGDWKRVVADIGPAIIGELTKWLYFLRWVLPLAILFLIPGLNLAAPFLWMILSAWMLALEYADYPLGNHELSFAAQRQWLRARRGAALGFGGATLVATLIPVVNFLVMPAAVAGATAFWVRNRETRR